MKLRITCENCPKTFFVDASRASYAKYCSEKCKNEYHRKKGQAFEDWQDKQIRTSVSPLFLPGLDESD